MNQQELLIWMGFYKEASEILCNIAENKEANLMADRLDWSDDGLVDVIMYDNSGHIKRIPLTLEDIWQHTVSKGTIQRK